MAYESVFRLNAWDATARIAKLKPADRTPAVDSRVMNACNSSKAHFGSPDKHLPATMLVVNRGSLTALRWSS